MPSERLIERSFSHAAALAEHKIIGCKLRQILATIEANQIMPPSETWLKDYSNNQLFCNENLQNIVTCNRPKQGQRSSSAREQRISINNNKDLCKQ